MRLNQVTVAMPDLDAGWDFYCTLGLKPVVDARPRYARFVCPDGDSTFSLHQGESGGSGPEDKSWLWREAELFDPRRQPYHPLLCRTEPHRAALAGG